MFYFGGYALLQVQPTEYCKFLCNEFPHSEIPGSKVAQHLPEAYRSNATSFIALTSQGIHHLPLIEYWLATHNYCFFIFHFTLPLFSLENKVPLPCDSIVKVLSREKKNRFLKRALYTTQQKRRGSICRFLYAIE